RHDRNILGVMWNTDGTYLLSWSVDGTARIWDTAAQTEIIRFTHESPVLQAAWNTDETRLQTFEQSGIAHLWSVDGDTLELVDLGQNAMGAVWSRDETQLLYWTFDRQAAIRNVTNGQVTTARMHGSFVEGARWNADETRF